jgi:hypothetical protein
VTKLEATTTHVLVFTRPKGLGECSFLDNRACSISYDKNGNKVDCLSIVILYFIPYYLFDVVGYL